MFTLVLIGQCNYFAFGLSSSPCLAKSFVRARANWYKTNKQTKKQTKDDVNAPCETVGGRHADINLIFAAFFFFFFFTMLIAPQTHLFHSPSTYYLRFPSNRLQCYEMETLCILILWTMNLSALLSTLGRQRLQ